MGVGCRQDRNYRVDGNVGVVTDGGSTGAFPKLANRLRRSGSDTPMGGGRDANACKPHTTTVALSLARIKCRVALLDRRCVRLSAKHVTMTYAPDGLTQPNPQHRSLLAVARSIIQDDDQRCRKGYSKPN